MQFSDTTNYTGLIQVCEDLTDLGLGTISGSTTYLKKFTNYINSENRLIIHDIFSVYKGWVYDDGENTDLPQATADITSGTYQMALPADIMHLLRVEVKTSGGEWKVLEPYIIEQSPEAIAEMNTKSGEPTHYRVFGDTIELYPKPNYSSTGGFRVYFTRSSVDFTYSDTTQSPGFNKNYHDILALGASIKWLKIKQPNSNTLPLLLQDYMERRGALVDFYAMRFASNLPDMIRPATHNFE